MNSLETQARVDEGKREYARLTEYAGIRTQELAPMIRPYVEVTDRYGELLCSIVLVLGKTPPSSERDTASRDLMADVFDFLYEARALILKGKLEVAYPLARRAYESLSLLAACQLEPKLADRWIAGEQVGNAEVRRVLAAHPMGEKEAGTKELYGFFSKTTHPNRTHMAGRHLGDGNEFVLGAVGVPSLPMLADYALKTLNLWFWFGAFVVYVNKEIIARHAPEILDFYRSVSADAGPIAKWLVDRYNEVLAEEIKLMRGTSSKAP